MGVTKVRLDRGTPPFQSALVAEKFASFPTATRDGLLALRHLIFETAEATPGVGALEETLKWGQPAYLTPQTKSGSTLRLGRPKHGGFALYTHCQTTLLSEFKALFPVEFDYEGVRAIRFKDGEPIPLDKLRLLVSRALTYHLKPRRPMG